MSCSLGAGSVRGPCYTPARTARTDRRARAGLASIHAAGASMPEDRAISRSVLAEQVKDRLLQDILSGVYPPNSRIVETRVARVLGTSHAPVREALRGLEALGV